MMPVSINRSQNPIIIDQGETFEPEDGIKNKDELPEDTEYSDATPDSVDTSKNYTAIIIVTYPDGSKDKVKVPVTVRPKKQLLMRRKKQMPINMNRNQILSL